MNKPNDNLNHAIDALKNSPVPQGPSDQLMRQTLNQIEQLQDQLPPATEGKRRFSMKTITKLAVAACVLFAVLGGITLIDKNSGIVLAEVAQRVQQAKAFSYQMQMTITGEYMAGTDANSPTNLGGTVWMTADNRMKMEMSMNGKIGSIVYLLPDQKKMVSVMPEQKKYMEVDLTDDLLSNMKQQNQDPREWLKRMADSQYKSLGKSTLDGVEVEGFETTDPAIAGGVSEKALARIWVNVETGYPVQMDTNMDMNEGKTKIHSVIHNFQWNQDVDAEIFTPQIGNDYTAMPKMQMPKMDESSVVAGFQKYLDMTDGYPENLSLVTLMEDFQKAFKDKTAMKKLIDPNQLKAMSQDEKIKWGMEQMMPVQSLAMFYMMLVQKQKDPAYYGKTVAPGDAQAVLLRWKASDTTYKVIMGDLSVSEMSNEQLKLIEPQTEPLQPVQ